MVTTIAGDGTFGFADGAALSAQFRFPGDVEVASDGALYVTDGGNERIRKIAGGQVSTFAGNDGFDIVNGIGAAAFFKSPVPMAMGSRQNSIHPTV
jgi:hypothetical protein